MKIGSILRDDDFLISFFFFLPYEKERSYVYDIKEYHTKGGTGGVSVNRVYSLDN